MQTDTDLLDQQVTSDASMYAIDQPVAKENLIVPTAGELVISGWAMVAVNQPVPTAVFIEIRSEKTGQVQVIKADRLPRPDIANFYGNPDLLFSGFQASVPLVYSMYGKYYVKIAQHINGIWYRSDELLQFEAQLQEYERAAREGLAAKFLNGHGIEIGALQRRLTLQPGCSVTYVDRMPYEDLIRHYPELKDLPIQRPDVIDNGEELARFGDSSQDFVVANHLLEHCLDPIRTIQNFLRVLRPAGILIMAVPDRRYTFDFTRPTTTYDAVKQTYLTGERENRKLLYLEWAEHVLQLKGDAAQETAAKLDAEDYSIHCNVWTLADLMEFLLRARADLHLPFSIASIVSAENENILVLERH